MENTMIILGNSNTNQGGDNALPQCHSLVVVVVLMKTKKKRRTMTQL